MTDIAIPETGLQLALDLDRAGALTAVSLDLTAEIDITRYEALGTFLGSLKRSASWWIGDWLLFGEATHGELMAQAMNATGLAQETLTHYRNVCEQIPKSRRRPNLSFGVHALVRTFTPAKQKSWLDKAEKNEWDAQALKHAIADVTAKETGEQTTIEGTSPTRRKVDKALVVEAAFAVVRDMRDAEDPTYMLVPVETITRLLAALGEAD